MPQDYATIHEAVGVASPGDTVLVSAGNYIYDYANITKSVSVIGEGASKTRVESGRIFEVHADNVTISGFTMYCLASCVELYESHGCNISNNIMLEGWNTIALVESSNNTIAHNNIFPSDNGLGILLIDFSENNTIYANNVTGAMSGAGVWVYSSPNNKVECNRVMGNHYGIFIDSNDNRIIDNVVENNWEGITCWGGRRNRVYHNNLINNPSEVVDTGENFWDNGCEGNYWNNYNGTDLDGDGIGDTYLPWRGVDHHPLMTPYWNPADVNHDLKVNLYDAVRVLAAYGSGIGDENYNPHCDIAEPYGTIDLFDATVILTNYGKRW